jgi:hypothetical protein
MHTSDFCGFTSCIDYDLLHSRSREATHSFQLLNFTFWLCNSIVWPGVDVGAQKPRVCLPSSVYPPSVVTLGNFNLMRPYCCQ